MNIPAPGNEQAAPVLHSRAATYLMPPPRVLMISTPELAGEWYSAQLSGCDKIRDTYWFDLGENHADVYATHPDADFVIVGHSGAWNDRDGRGIEQQVDALAAELNSQDPYPGQMPLVVVSTIGASWNICKRWAEHRSVNSVEARRVLHGVEKGVRRDRERREYTVQPDPNATITIGENLWNDAHAQHRRLMGKIRRLPAIVVLHAYTTPSGDGIEAHVDVARQVHAQVRVHPGGPVVTSARSYNHFKAQRDGELPEADPDFTLEELIFGTLGYELPAAAVDPIDQTS